MLKLLLTTIKKNTMRKNLIFVAFFLFQLIAIHNCMLGQNKTISISLNDIERKDIITKGVTYEKIVMKNASTNFDIGKPDLPVIYYKFYVPKGEKVSNANFNSSQKSEFILLV